MGELGTNEKERKRFQEIAQLALLHWAGSETASSGYSAGHAKLTIFILSVFLFRKPRKGFYKKSTPRKIVPNSNLVPGAQK